MRFYAEKIVKKIHANGHEACFAGGCVRDMAMGTQPDDYDIATSAHPDEIIGLFRKTVKVGARFGVVIVIMGGHQFEVATYRTESSYSDGRRPDAVEFATAREDVERRDFTINGLLYDILNDEVIDFVGGREDIKRKVIRTIGDPMERFREDRLRMLRAVRFAARLEFSIDPATLDAIKRMAPGILDVSMERISMEMTKMLTAEHADVALEILRDTGLLHHVMPGIEQMIGVQQPEEFHPEGDVFDHTKLMLRMLEKPSDVLAFAVLFHDIGKPATFTVTDRIRFHCHDQIGADMTDEILRSLKFSNEKRQKVVAIVRNHMRLMHAPKMRESTLKRLLRRDIFDEELELHRIDCLASHKKLDVYNFLIRKRDELPPEVIKPPALIDGHDLIDMGFVPGPMFKKILDAAEELQLENKLTTKEEALRWISENYSTERDAGPL